MLPNVSNILNVQLESQSVEFQKGDSLRFDEYISKRSKNQNRPWSAKTGNFRPCSSKSPSSKIPRFIESTLPVQEKSSKQISEIYGGGKSTVYKQVEMNRNFLRPRNIQSAFTDRPERHLDQVFKRQSISSQKKQNVTEELAIKLLREQNNNVKNYNSQLKQEIFKQEQVMAKIVAPVAKFELMKMQGQNTTNQQMELLHAQASSNFEMMVSYKQQTRTLQNENSQLQKQVQFLKKNIHLTQYAEIDFDYKELLRHCEVLREHLKSAAMDTYNQQQIIRKQRRTIQNMKKNEANLRKITISPRKMTPIQPQIDLKQYSSQISDLQKQLKDAKATIKSQQRSIKKSLERENLVLTQVSLKPEKSQIQKDIDKYVSQLQAELEKQKQKVVDLENSPQSQEIKQLKLKIENLNNIIDEKSQIQDSEALQKEMMDQKYKQLEGDLSELLQEKDKFLEDLIQKDTEIEELQKSNEKNKKEHEEQIQNLQKQIQENEKVIQENEKLYQEQLQSFQAEIDSLNQNQSSAEVENKKQFLSSNLKANMALNVQKLTVNSLKKQQEEAELEKERILQEEKKINQDLSGDKEQLIQKLQKQSEENEELKSQIDKFLQEKEELSQQLSQRNEEHREQDEKMKEEIKQQMEQLQALKQQLEEKDKQIALDLYRIYRVTNLAQELKKKDLKMDFLDKLIEFLDKKEDFDENAAPKTKELVEEISKQIQNQRDEINNEIQELKEDNQRYIEVNIKKELEIVEKEQLNKIEIQNLESNLSKVQQEHIDQLEKIEQEHIKALENLKEESKKPQGTDQSTQTDLKKKANTQVRFELPPEDSRRFRRQQSGRQSAFSEEREVQMLLVKKYRKIIKDKSLTLQRVHELMLEHCSNVSLIDQGQPLLTQLQKMLITPQSFTLVLKDLEVILPEAQVEGQLTSRYQSKQNPDQMKVKYFMPEIFCDLM